TCTPEEIADFCVETVKIAGPDACPPYVLGVGIGGTMEQCALLAKKALLGPIDKPNPKPHIAKLEERIKERVKALDIGVMGLGGKSTVIGVNIEVFPTHIAGCPVAVNLSCHALRSATAEM
ncbi:MAG: fumarate hydratase, partial [Candidatus Omnitrophota bacterium]|nr:fumarate hydratase [Candidatus Omnitrophota bacterium]